MDGLISAAGIALTAAVFALLIKKDAPGVAFLMTVAAGLLIFTVAVRGVGSVMDSLSGVLRAADIDEGIYLPVLKAVGIAAVVRIVGALCQDAGQSSLAAKIELVGAVAAMAVTLPLFTRVLSLVGSMIS